MTTYIYWLIVASLQMGQPMLEVRIDSSEWVSSWAATCVSCVPNRYTITHQTICYNNQEFTRYVAYHEACHVFMGHDLERHEAGFSSDVAEHQANLCMTHFMGVTFDDIYEVGRKANAWEKRQGDTVWVGKSCSE